MRKAFAGILTAVMCMSLTGCGGGKQIQDTSTAEEDYAYIPSIISIDSQAYTHSGNYTINGDNLYYTKTEWSEQGDSQVSIIRMDPRNGNSEEVPVDADNADILAMCMDGDGNYHLACMKTEYDENGNLLNAEYYIRKLDPAGKEIGRIDYGILQKSDAESFYVNGMVMDQDGVYYLTLGESIAAINDKGEVQFSIDIPSYVDGMGVGRNGEIVVCFFDQGSDGWKMKGQLIDKQAKKLGAVCDNFPMLNGSSYIGTGVETDLLIPTENGIVGYCFADGSRKEYLNFIDNDLMVSDTRFVQMLANGDIILVSEDYALDKTEVIYCERVPADSVVKEKILTLGGMSFSEDIKRHVVDFNRANSEYKIKLIEYDSDGLEYEDAEANMNNAIASGNGADMYVIRDMDMGRKYASKGVFLDLNTFLEQDPEIHPENYYENILKMYSYDGLCYAVFPRFIIQSYVGRQSVLGDRTSWTPQDVMELIQEYPDKVFCPYIQKQGLLSMLVCNDLDHYIDWETGKCSFDTQEFMDVLKFVNEAVPDAEGSEYSEEEDMLYYNNKALVTDAYLYSLQEIQLYMRLSGEPVTFIGLPISSGSGNLVIPAGDPIAISSKCKDPKVAWEFVRYYLLPEFQNVDEERGIFGFPVLRSAMDQYMKNAMIPETYTNENGEEVEVTNTWGVNGVEVEIGAVTQEECDIFLELVNNCTASGTYDEKMIEILTEEANAYFRGGKSVEEAVKVIQSRLSIYVSENM